jgi:hypothetical protein
LSADGKAMKFFELTPFELHLTVEVIVAALHQDEATSTGHPDPAGTSHPSTTTADGTELSHTMHDTHDVKETPR